MSTQQDSFFFDSIIFKLSRAIDWRRGCALRFPDDSRNLKAVSELQDLAASKLSDVLPETWALVTPHKDADYIGECINLAIRSVGFRRKPIDLDTFIKSIVFAAKQFELPASIGGK